ncbi:MAG: SulP family inorganic anion transporter [Cyanobacteriota bacterium]
MNSWLKQFSHVLKPPDLHFRNFRDDFWGGLTAAIVALPLALAFGVSSGAGATTGLYGAIFVGIFAALFGGTPAQVAGAKGAVAVVVSLTTVSLGPETQSLEIGLIVHFGTTTVLRLPYAKDDPLSGKIITALRISVPSNGQRSASPKSKI